jgi:hypothetical protein
MPGGWRLVARLAVLLGVAGVLPASATFSPVLDIFVSSPALSANSNVRIATSLPAGNDALGTWSLNLPVGWNVSADSAVPNGDVVGRGVMSVDTDCNGSVQNYGPFNLVDAAVDPGGDAPVARWVGPGTSWWNFVIVVDQVPGEPFDISADLTNFNEFHPLCAPQSLIVTIFGRSSPSNSVVLTNPSSAGSKVWAGSFASFGGASITNVNDSVCIGTTCDTDSDTVPDITDNCLAWPNQPQNLPPWPVPANDPDCDGFSSAVEDPAGTNPLVHCGFNAWPSDLNNDTFSDGTDITIIAGSFGKSVPPAPVRHNIAPDPVDGFVDGTDITRVAGLFNKHC